MKYGMKYGMKYDMKYGMKYVARSPEPYFAARTTVDIPSTSTAEHDAYDCTKAISYSCT